MFEVLAWLVEKNGGIYRGVDANEHPKLVADRINWVGREAAGFDPMDFIITGLWLDAAPFSETNDSLYLLLFQILGIPDKMRRWIVCFNKKNQCGCGCKGRCTYDSVWNVVAWMYRVLKSGIAPTHRHDGVAFSASKLIGDQKRAKRAEAGYRLPKACNLRKKSDWAGFKQCLNLVGWRGEGILRRICYVCCATTDDFMDASGGAPWRQRYFISHAAFMADLHHRGYVSVYWDVPGQRNTYLIVDLMHCGCLGIVGILNANVLLELLYRMGGTIREPDAVLGALTRITKMAARNCTPPIQFPVNTITINMVKRQGIDPKFRVKAAENRRMLAVIDWLLDNMYLPRGDHERLVQRCVKQLASFYKECEPARWDPSSSPAKIATFAQRHLVLYGELRRGAEPHDAALGYYVYKWYPKHHLFGHVPETSGGENPRGEWAYADEDAIGDAVNIASEVSAPHVHSAVIDRYRL